MTEGTGALPIGWVQLLLASSLVLVAGIISLCLRLGLERRLAWASLRTVVQLLMVGSVLTWVFSHEDPRILGGVIKNIFNFAV